MPVTKQLIVLPLDELKPYANNPRINDDAVADVVASIEQCEALDPIEIDENNVILSGHTRLKALKQLGYEKIECIRYTGLSEDKKKKYRLLTNKTGEKAEWDLCKLEVETSELDFGSFDFGFDEPFSIDDIEEVSGYDKNNDDREYFEKVFTFPIEKKQAIINYCKKQENYDRIIAQIIREAEEYANGSVCRK